MNISRVMKYVNNYFERDSISYKIVDRLNDVANGSLLILKGQTQTPKNEYIKITKSDEYNGIYTVLEVEYDTENDTTKITIDRILPSYIGTNYGDVIPLDVPFEFSDLVNKITIYDDNNDKALQMDGTTSFKISAISQAFNVPTKQWTEFFRDELSIWKKDYTIEQVEYKFKAAIYDYVSVDICNQSYGLNVIISALYSEWVWSNKKLTRLEFIKNNMSILQRYMSAKGVTYASYILSPTKNVKD